MKLFFKVFPAFLVFCPYGAFAEKLNPFKAETKEAVSLQSVIQKHLKPGRGKNLIEVIEPIKFNTKIFGVGIVSLQLDRKWLPGGTRTFETPYGLHPDPNDPIYFRGTATLRTMERKGSARKKKSIPITATLFNSAAAKTRLTISFEGNTPTNRFFELSTEVNSGIMDKLMTLSHFSANVLSDKKLDEIVITGKARELSLKRSANASAANRVVQISTESDYQWGRKYGDDAITRVNSIINKMEAIYEEQFNLVFSIVAQNSLETNSRYTATFGSDLLKSFADYTNSNGHLGQADVYHLFTGKNTTTLDQNNNLTDALIGLAYSVKIGGTNYGVICVREDLVYSFTENTTSSLNHITTSHEIGHNFGATHTSSGGIMSTELNADNPPKSFSSFSVNEISSHINNYGSCLSLQVATPIPTSGTAPTASPVATNRGGNSGSGDFDADTPVHLSASLSKEGVIDIDIILDQVDSSCSITLLASDNINKLNIGTVLASFTAENANTSYQEIIFKKIPKLNKKGKKIKVYFKLRQSCADGEVNFSEVRNVQPSKVKSEQKAISPKQWINLLKEELASEV